MNKMNFDTKPSLRRVDRPAETATDEQTAPVFVRREPSRRRERQERNHEQEKRPSLMALIAPVLRNAWGRLTKAQTWALGLAMGLVIGLPLLGWWLWPVEWTNASFNELAPMEQALVIETVADYYAYSSDPVRVAAVLNGWRDGESLICAMAAQEDDFWARARLISIAAVRNGKGCE